MTDYEVKRLALVLAVQTEVKGMEWENTKRIQNNESLAYTEADFVDKASELRELTYRPAELL